MSVPRLTPAQWRGLALLATPGAEAHSGTLVRWNVYVGGARIGSIHSESLAALRNADLVEMFKVDAYPHGFHHRITDTGLAAHQARAAATTDGAS